MAMIMTGTPAAGQSVGNAVAVPGFGEIRDLPYAQERPNPKLRYRVVFSISKAAGKPGEANPSLLKVARFLNLLAHDGIRPRKGDIVAIAFGPATSALVQDPAPSAGASNPNSALIEKLQAAGVIVAVCSQAMQGQGYTSKQMLPGVRIDDAAIVTMANLQLSGFALIPD